MIGKKYFLFAIFLTLFLFISSFSYAENIDERWIFNSESAELNLELSSSINLIKERDSKIESITVRSSFFPRSNHNLEILDKIFFPITPKESNDDLTYSFQNPKFDSEEIGYLYNLKLNNKFTKINKKISLPLDYSKIPFDYREYISPAKIIDSDNLDIIALAEDLSEDIDDLYVLSFTFAKWVKDNINYVLEPITSDSSQSASWTLENKKGVCDEFTALFMALMRAKGIPVRYVSGIAYTNSELFTEDWGFHGWAQVYFPEIGWVDFDPTYGQFGYVDLSHIPLKYSLDSGESSMSYSIKSYNAKMETTPLKEKIEISNIKPSYESPENNIDVKVHLNSESFSFGSHILLIVEIDNKNDFYYPYFLNLGKTYSLDAITEKEKNILLLPNEKRTEYFILKISESDELNLIDRNEYVFPIVLYTIRNNTYETEFKVGKKYSFFSLSDIEKHVEILFPKDEKKSNDIKIFSSCSQLKEYYSYEKIEFECTVKNYDLQKRENLKLCLISNEEYCSDSISINGNSDIRFLILVPGESIDEYGFIKTNIFLDNILINNGIFKSNILPEINISFAKIEYPEKIRFSQGFEILIGLSSNTDEEINGNIAMEYESFSENFPFTISTNERKFSIRLNSGAFIRDSNVINFMLNYSDRNDKKYELSQQINIELFDLTVLEKIELFFNRLGFKVMKLFEN